MALPLFAASCWGGHIAARYAGADTGKHRETIRESLVISLICALLLTPVWFEINKTDNPVTAQPLVFPHAHDSGDVYSVPPGVIVALVCVCLVPAALWLGRALVPAAAPRPLAAAVPLLLASAVPVLAWLLYRAGAHAYASQVLYAATASHPAASHTAPFAVGYQVAHALQDGLAGQAAGLPALALLLATRPSPPPTRAYAGGTIPTATEEAPE